MYIKHIASAFRNRFVYDETQDLKDLNEIVKTVASERAIPSASESLTDKLKHFKKSIYERNKIEMPKSTSKLTIKENTTNGWGPYVEKKKTVKMHSYRLVVYQMLMA